MSYLTQYQIAVDTDFIHRVEQASLEAAIAVMTEDPAAVGGAEAHALRAAFAQQVLHNSARTARKIAMCVVSTGQVTETSGDNVIATAVSVVWNPFSGYNPNMP